MNAEKVTEICAKYAADIRSTRPDMAAERLPDAGAKFMAHYISPLAMTQHMLFLCEEIPKLMAAGRVEKAMRWLGWLQGALWGTNFETLEDAKMRNAPEGATYSRDA